uniref:Uncharacterized protein n=1 Tax=Solanum lycopersicum TaxID=4081 RepID=A0A3Q7ET88_SOLLC
MFFVHMVVSILEFIVHELTYLVIEFLNSCPGCGDERSYSKNFHNKSKDGGSIISEFCSADFRNAVLSTMSASDMVIHGERHHRPKLQNMSQELNHDLWSQILIVLHTITCDLCLLRFLFLNTVSSCPKCAHFEKLGSKSFSVYSIAVTDANSNFFLIFLWLCLADILLGAV